MPLPKIREETRNRLCPPEVFCEGDPARKFVADTLAGVEESNPFLFDLLWNKMLFGPRNANLMKSATFDGVLSACAICRLIMAEGTLPVISKDTFEQVWQEFKADREEFVRRMGDRVYDPQITFVMAVCCANYHFFEYEEECRLVQAVAFMVYRMLELQAELEVSVK